MSKFIRLDQVKAMTGLSRSSIYQFIKDKKFPPQIKLGTRAVAWDASEIQEWMSSCIAQRTNN